MLKRKISVCCACSNNSSVLLSEKFEQEQQVSKHTVKKNSFLDLFTRIARADSGVYERPCDLSKSPVPLLIPTVWCHFKLTRAV